MFGAWIGKADTEAEQLALLEAFRDIDESDDRAIGIAAAAFLVLSALNYRKLAPAIRRRLGRPQSAAAPAPLRRGYLSSSGCTQRKSRSPAR
jgi:hypothetical protein